MGEIHVIWVQKLAPCEKMKEGQIGTQRDLGNLTDLFPPQLSISDKHGQIYIADQLWHLNSVIPSDILARYDTVSQAVTWAARI